MRRTTPALALLAVGLAIAGCSDDEDDSGGDDGGSAEETSAFCAAAEAAVAPGQGALSAEEQLDRLEDFATEAPDEIADDFEILIEAFEAAVEVQGSVDTPEVQAARSNIEDYVSAECGVELSPTTAG